MIEAFQRHIERSLNLQLHVTIRIYPYKDGVAKIKIFACNRGAGGMNREQ
jgi:hypothetical protein